MTKRPRSVSLVLGSGGIHAVDELDTWTDWAFQRAKTDAVNLLDFSNPA